MEREEMRRGLENAGLSSYQADAFLTLLDQGVSPAVEIARNCSVPMPRIYDVLKDLEQKGYVETVERDTVHARARNPVNVIEDLHDQSELLSDTATEIEDRWERSPLGDHEMNVMRRAETVITHAKEALLEAETVVDMALSYEQLLEFEPTLEEVPDDVVVRVSVYADDSIVLEEGTIPTAVTELRRRAVPGPMLVIVDRLSAYFAPTTRMPNPYGLVVNDDIISFVFQWYFQTCLWSPWDRVHTHREYPIEYVSLDEFIQDVYPLWRNDATVTVTIDGIETNAGERRELTGTITGINYTGMDVTSEDVPTVAQLAGQSWVSLETADYTYQVGSWGAIFEDIEARRIVLHSIEFERPGRTDRSHRSMGVSSAEGD